jgi:hypothetical protein
VDVQNDLADLTPLGEARIARCVRQNDRCVRLRSDTSADQTPTAVTRTSSEPKSCQAPVALAEP